MFDLSFIKKMLMLIIVGIFLMSSFSIADERLITVSDVERVIQTGEFTVHHYLYDFEEIPKLYQNSEAYGTYLNGVWLASLREYDSAAFEFYKALDLLEDAEDDYLEMLILEKLIEIDEVNGDLINYQDNAFKLRTLSSGLDDKKFIKALYAIADAHFRTYNDEIAKSYLSVIFEESSRIDYAYGLSRYHLLYGDMESAYNNFDDAAYHYQKSYEYGLESEKLLSICYQSMIEIRMARTETFDEQYEAAYNRLKSLLTNIDKKSSQMRRDIYYEIGLAAFDLENYEEALTYLDLAITNDYLVNKTFEVHAFDAEVYDFMGLVYTALGEYEEATLYFELSMLSEDYVDSEEIRAQQVSALNAYEIDELQRELTYKRQIKKANDETIALQRQYLQIGFWMVIALVICLIVLIWLYFARGRIQKKLYYESITDHLTKVYNRGHIIHLLEQSIDHKTCVLMVDLDDFKMINDTFGHVTGDNVLVRIAETIDNNLREDDYIGRYGGEEFLIILNRTDIEKGLKVAERIRMAVEEIVWEEDITTTLSIGLLQSKNLNADEVLMEADILMYRAKSLGKNRVVF